MMHVSGSSGAASAGWRTLTCVAATAAVLLASAPTGWAGGVQSYYPTALEPVLPDATEARRLIVQPASAFQVLRHAHGQSLQRSWKSITPPVADPTTVTP